MQPAAHDGFLDGLRGVAILMVVAGHSPFIGVWLPNWGRTGVYLFFVLSSFLLLAILAAGRVVVGVLSVLWSAALRLFRIALLSVLVAGLALVLAFGSSVAFLGVNTRLPHQRIRIARSQR